MNETVSLCIIQTEASKHKTFIIVDKHAVQGGSNV